VVTVTQPVTSVNLNKTTTTITVSNTEQLTAIVLPINASNKTVTWNSNNSAVATVNTAGLVTTVSAGTTIVTVTTQDGSYTASCTVTVIDLPITFSAFTINNGTQVTLRRTVNLNCLYSGGIPTHFRVAENETALSSTAWQIYNPSALTYFFATNIYEFKTIYSQLKNSVGETEVRSASIIFKLLRPKLALTAFSMNNNAISTNSRAVTLNHTVENDTPTVYSVSENLLQVGRYWLPYTKTPVYTLSEGIELKEVYFVVANGTDTSNILSARIYLDESVTIGGNGLNAKLFPNPVENQLNVVVKDVTLPVQIMVYSIIGEVYLSQTFDTSTFGINLSRCPAGALLVRIICGDKYTVKRIIKL
jgi:hypothetical protein